MFVTENKGLINLKLTIHRMTNHKLIFELYSIRITNSNCIPKDDNNCNHCNITQCYRYLTYEEMITDELINRGLFEFALKTCHKKSKLIYKDLRDKELILYYS
ncbi:MAG: hypothetical protein FK731_05805 [Asgard group archaeon]|nr:hypothetical protein [Asgard group archaeon]